MVGWFWFFGRKFLLSRAASRGEGQAQGAEEVGGGGCSQSMTTMQSFSMPPFQLHLEFHPQVKDFPPKSRAGGVSPPRTRPGHSPKPNPESPPRSCRATLSVPLSSCPLSWLFGMNPVDNRDGRACWTSFLVETTQNCAALGLQKQLDGSRASRFHRHRSQGWAGLISATELKKKEKKSE